MDTRSPIALCTGTSRKPGRALGHGLRVRALARAGTLSMKISVTVPARGIDYE